MNKEDTVMTFFYGEVVLLEQLALTAKYVVRKNGMILEIDNSMHIRLVEDQMKLSPIFLVIAPIIAITSPFEGTIPAELIVRLPARDYLKLRMKHHGA
ncbi:MAG: hypothetical protein RBS43_10260 [Candidatus Cloacimonas sp.]|jgi:hypothetical protein|nr:hypothetical protein [Candidatus Cloacimonas sp.]